MPYTRAQKTYPSIPLTAMCRANLLAQLLVLFVAVPAYAGDGADLCQGGWVRRWDRGDYNASTCFIMKARYNCKEDTRSPGAAAWWHVPDKERQPNTTWRDLLQAYGGGNAFEGAVRATDQYREHGSHARPLNILIVGTSFMRQVFEAATCRWRARITGGRLRTDGPHMGMAELRDNGNITKNQTSLTHLSAATTMMPPCHGQDFRRHKKPVSVFYRGGLPASQLVPLNATDRRFCQSHTSAPSGFQFCGFPVCNDNLATIEFSRRLRLHYIFRPYAYADGLDQVLDHLGIQAEHVDVLACNDHCAKVKKNWAGTLGGLYRSREEHTGQNAGKGAFFLDFGKVRATMQVQMERDLGHLYGATNAQYKDDGHACMPGLPDDEVDILFSAIRHGRPLVTPTHIKETDAEFWNRDATKRPDKPKEPAA